MTELNSYEYIPKQKAKMLIILLHGYGANGADLFGLKHYLISSLGRDIVILAPDAPQICEMGMGPDYRQWFSLANRDSQMLQQQIITADPILKDYIKQQLKKHGLTADKLIIAGFSQGCMMALYSGLGLADAPAVIIGWSGMFIEGGNICNQAPVQLWHGDMDEVVPMACLNDAKQKLASFGIDADTHIVKGAGHTIAPEALEGSINFIRNHIKTS